MASQQSEPAMKLGLIMNIVKQQLTKAQAKNVVQTLEKYAVESEPEKKYSVLVIIDAVIRLSRDKFGVNDKFSPFFALNLMEITRNIYEAVPPSDKPKVAQIILGWQIDNLFAHSILEPLLPIINNWQCQRSQLPPNSGYNRPTPQYCSPQGVPAVNPISSNIPLSTFPSSGNMSASHRPVYRGVYLPNQPPQYHYNYPPPPQNPTGPCYANIHHQPPSCYPNLGPLVNQYPIQPPMQQMPQQVLPPPPIPQAPLPAEEHYHAEERQKEPYSARSTSSPVDTSSPRKKSTPNRNKVNESRKQGRYFSGDKTNSSPRATLKSAVPTERSRSRSPPPKKATFVDGTSAETQKRLNMPLSKANCVTFCSNTLWLGHLPDDCTKQSVEEVFSNFGPIHSTVFTEAKHCAFICMKRRADASSAYDRLTNNKILCKKFGNQVMLSWAPAKGLKTIPGYSDYWQPGNGWAFVPFSAFNTKDDIEAMGIGSTIDRQSLPDHLKDAVV